MSDLKKQFLELATKLRTVAGIHSPNNHDTLCDINNSVIAKFERATGLSLGWAHYGFEDEEIRLLMEENADDIETYAAGC